MTVREIKYAEDYELISELAILRIVAEDVGIDNTDEQGMMVRALLKRGMTEEEIDHRANRFISLL